MNILITGGAGFIGSHLAEHLTGRGDRVAVIDNLATGSSGNIGGNRAITLFEDDIADRSALDTCIETIHPDAVIHAAASYKDPSNWAEDVRTNVLGTANVVKSCQDHGIRRLIYFQTALCYGLKPASLPITVGHPLEPGSSSYAISKTTGEYYIRISGLDYLSFRLANIIGPRNLSGPAPVFYRRLREGKSCFVTDTRRDFIFVDDLVDLVTRALDTPGVSGVFHASSGGDYAIKELFTHVASSMGFEHIPDVEFLPRNPADAPTIMLDPSETHRAFGWTASTPMGKAIHAAIVWYDKHGVDHAYTHFRQRAEN